MAHRGVCRSRLPVLPARRKRALCPSRSRPCSSALRAVPPVAGNRLRLWAGLLGPLAAVCLLWVRRAEGEAVNRRAA